jgi:putative membrane protein
MSRSLLVTRILASAAAAALILSAAPVVHAQTSSRDFVVAAAQSDAYEREAGHIAARKARSSAVRRFGQMMASAHARTTRTLKAALQREGRRAPPPAMSPEQDRMIADLRGAGRSFDSMYVDQQIQAHEQALSLLQDYARSGDDRQLRRVASNTIPLVREHLQEARRLQRNMRG